jgi:hypothetical protein
MKTKLDDFFDRSKEETQKLVDESCGLYDLWIKLDVSTIHYPTSVYKKHLERLGIDLSGVIARGRNRFLLPEYEGPSERKKSRVLNVGKKEACRLNGIKSGEAKTKRLID